MVTFILEENAPKLHENVLKEIYCKFIKLQAQSSIRAFWSMNEYVLAAEADTAPTMQS